MRMPLIGSGSRAARATEATDQQLITSGAVGLGGYDPIDGDVGYRRLGSGMRDVPWWTLEKTRAFSVAAYRTNPMARAIFDTYTSFCVGGSGLTVQCPDPDVRQVVDSFLNDPRAPLLGLQELMLRSHLINGESAYEMMIGDATGVVRWSPIDPARVVGVSLVGGNPLWPAQIRVIQPAGDDFTLDVVAFDDLLGRRVGEVEWFASFKTTLTDTRGFPFLGPIVDWLDSYDNVLGNLVDRTAIARYLVWDVTVDGDNTAIEDFVTKRGGKHAPRSGTIEVHNKSVEWKPQTAQTGTFEDTNTTSTILTNIAGGAGLAKHWLAEPDNANRATSMTMAEPVRRRVSGVQNMWLHIITEIVRFAVDQAVAKGTLDATVTITDRGGAREVPAADTVKITGPEIAATDPQISATVLVNLSTSLNTMVAGGLLSEDAAQLAARKAWEDFVGVPYSADLDKPTAETDDVADYVDDKTAPQRSNLLSLLGQGATA